NHVGGVRRATTSAVTMWGWCTRQRERGLRCDLRVAPGRRGPSDLPTWRRRSGPAAPERFSAGERDRRQRGPPQSVSLLVAATGR
ncbi:MAG: hypothetical protein L0H96_26185, partial [Humibacillus sp.]|nr:hypothetical protein [Humibacillus sp.]